MSDDFDNKALRLFDINIYDDLNGNSIGLLPFHDVDSVHEHLLNVLVDREWSMSGPNHDGAYLLSDNNDEDNFIVLSNDLHEDWKYLDFLNRFYDHVNNDDKNYRRVYMNEECLISFESFDRIKKANYYTDELLEMIEAKDYMADSEGRIVWGCDFDRLAAARGEISEEVT